MILEAVQRWLTAHCQGRGDIVGAVVVRHAAAAANAASGAVAKEGDAEMVARYPVDSPPPSLHGSLTNVAREALRRGSSFIMVPAVVQKDADYARVAALPVRGESAVVGAVAIAVRSQDAAVAKRILDEVERLTLSLAASLAPSTAKAPPATARAGGEPVNLLNLVAANGGLRDCASKLATQIAADGRFDRVSISLMQGGQLRLIAVSSTRDVDERQDAMRVLLAAHIEAADQDATVCYPQGLQGAALITQQHARAAMLSGTAYCTTCLRADGRLAGALSFERKANSSTTVSANALVSAPNSAPGGGHGPTPINTEERAACESMAGILGPALALKQEASRGAWWRLTNTVRGWWGGRGQTERRVVLVVAVLALLAFLFVPVTFNVAAPSRVEGAIQRVIAAPMDGYIKQTHVRPGDSVRKGGVLVELADQELALEKRKWESELTRHQTNFSAALGKSDRAQFAVNFARASEAKAQLDLVEQQLARARVTAPMDALVIAGDLTQMIGAPVKRGDTLLTLAPRDQYRIIIEVDERDIGYVQLGQKGRMALGALPGETLPIAVQRITPVANVTRDGRNVYDVEARLESAGAAPRHGLQGVAKIETVERPLAWILTRRVIGWMKLGIWGWLP